MTTTTNETIASALDKADPNKLADLLAKVKLGQLLTPQKRAISQSAAATVTLDPPALGIATTYANVTAGSAAAGVRSIADESESPAATLATLSDDGTTLTFEDTVTDVIVDYVPRSDTDITTDFPTTGLG